MSSLKIPLGLLALLLAASAGACFAQSARPAPSRVGLSRAYPNTADGLREMLTNMLATARTTDPGRIDALLVELEIPNPGRWFSSVFGPDEGSRDEDLYRRSLDDNENDLEMRIVRMARQGGEFLVRKVNDAPRGSEPVLLGSFRERPDLYFVSWKPKSGAADALPRPYFVFIDGKFRWETLLFARAPTESSEAQPSGRTLPQISESNIQRRPLSEPSNPPVFQPLYTPPSPSQPSSTAATVDTPGKNGVGFPACISCPAPEYPKSAAADGLQGTVVLRATIGADGRASDVMVVRTDELAFMEPAIAAVRNWRFKPAPGPDGKPVPVTTMVEVSFRVPATPTK